MSPDIMNGSGDTEAHQTSIEQSLRAAWNALPDSLLESLIESMPRRMEACLWSPVTISPRPGSARGRECELLLSSTFQYLLCSVHRVLLHDFSMARSRL
ncbi:hypothetical protein V1520DRAFT_97598 [Lipomyces starkeyi]|uniref:Uncharacterized protein n=1 Tax=Lipomyces starkeyi NRRL Y-11557 TaxID=675824 RepID=A0A1E3PYW7_LIPST|nr:hypothetical protein LIPSTDRAFT_172735 [Lipomyces starkeyi NRRL Y-11557]